MKLFRCATLVNGTTAVSIAIMAEDEDAARYKVIELALANKTQLPIVALREKPIVSDWAEVVYKVK